MGVPWRRILGIATDVAAVAVPGGAELDALTDRLLNVKGKTRADAERIDEVVVLAANVRQALASRRPKGLIESKRVLAAITNAIAVLVIYFGLPPEIADQVALYVSVPLTGYILGETVRPSVK